MANLNPEQMRRCNQSSLVRTPKGTAADTVLQGMQPSARDLMHTYGAKCSFSIPLTRNMFLTEAVSASSGGAAISLLGSEP